MENEEWAGGMPMPAATARTVVAWNWVRWQKTATRAPGRSISVSSVPKGYKPGMRVEGRILPTVGCSNSSWRPARNSHQRGPSAGHSVGQPGMPDIHWGYGFCIGGVCAAGSGGRRRDLAGRCRLRYQLRGPPELHLTSRWPTWRNRSSSSPTTFGRIPRRRRGAYESPARR